jgi:RND family efflux transporter MFP subunit
LFAASILTAAAGQWYCANVTDPVGADTAALSPPVLEVATIQVKPREWLVTVPFSGNLNSLSVVEIKSEVGGRLLATHFEEGDRVMRGQVLAEIDPTNYSLAHEQAVAALGVAEAGLARARVLLDHAVLEKERADNLLSSGGITEKDHQAALTSVKDAESQVKLAEAQCKQARVAISIAKKSLEDCRILALAAGRVHKKYYDPGSLLVPGSPVYTLVDNTLLELECSIPSYQFSGIRIGQEAEFTTPTWADQTFPARVSAINPTVESDNRTVKIMLKISNPGEKLRSGMFARGLIRVDREEQALVIPRSALVGEEGNSKSGSVYIVEDGHAVLHDVQIGGMRRDLLWIVSGLNTNDNVIIEVGPSLKDGIAVRTSEQSRPREQ